MTSKLKLKRTPEEESQHRIRKERRAEKKRKRKFEYDLGQKDASAKRFHEDECNLKWSSSDEEFGPKPIPSSSKIPPCPKYTDYDHDTEERLFREKMFDALGDDERLDSIESRFNDYVQIPERWRESSSRKSHAKFEELDDIFKLDPKYMDEEEYAEWIRAGMFRKSHADEYAEQQRKKAAEAARKAEAKVRKMETARLEKAADDERKKKKSERDSRRLELARHEYNNRWKDLLAAPNMGDVDPSMVEMLTFDDIPWPIMTVGRKHLNETNRASVQLEDMTAEGISSFLLSVDVGSSGIDAESMKKERKERLRETFRRFHPDKFEGRFLKRIQHSDREKVREAIGQISRILNRLMSTAE